MKTITREKYKKLKKMEIKPITFRAACDFVALNHRHHKPTVGCKFCVGLYEGEKLLPLTTTFALTSTKAKRMQSSAKMGRGKARS